MAKSKGIIPKSMSYKDGLLFEEKQRYEAKLTIVGGLDPYEEKLCWTQNVNVLPSVTYPDIVNYLLFTPSPYSADDLKAYKSLEAYNQFVCGWVRDKAGIVHGQHVIVMAKVLHSQRMREKPLRPWIIASKNGKVVAAHCNCMAGLGEACTHVAALLFSIEATVKIRDSKTVTDTKAYWLLPSDCKSVSYKEVRDINFVSAKTAKKQLDQQIDSTCAPTPSVNATPAVKNSRKVPEATHSDLMSFAEKLSKLDSKPALLSLIEPYAEKYVPKSDTKDFPKVLTELRNEKLIGANYKKLVDECADIEINCSKQQAENVEQQTKGQAASPLWFRFRAGRITASKAKAVCRTDKSAPSQSLVKAICYPDSKGFHSLATKWGRDHETTARDMFMEENGPIHDNSRIEDSGFVISESHPFVGASPDGIFVCDCCGSACVEVKCPYSARNFELNSGTCNYLSDSNGQLRLKRDHEYYYQVQAQLGVTKMEMCYFVVWTEKTCHVETIMFDDHIWEEICKEAKTLFYTGVLPELVGKFFTSLPESVLKSVGNTCTSGVNKNVENANSISCAIASEKLYCYCSQVEHGDMIGCDNTECSIEWFHYRCVKVEKPPKGNWYCPDCRKLPAFKRKRILK